MVSTSIMSTWISARSLSLVTFSIITKVRVVRAASACIPVRPALPKATQTADAEWAESGLQVRLSAQAKDATTQAIMSGHYISVWLCFLNKVHKVQLYVCVKLEFRQLLFVIRNHIMIRSVSFSSRWKGCHCLFRFYVDAR